jgi:hypothetical protein
VTRLNLAGVSGALDNINATQSEFRGQIAALNDLMRQVAGNANVAAGSGEMVDPLTAPFALYVNPYTGSDTFAAGSYNTYEAPGGSTDEEIIEAKLKRLDKQRLTCGFSPNRPFKTINRAIIEAAIITSKSWYTITDPKAHLDCVSIILAPGVHTVYNDPGIGTPVTWTDGYEPDAADLIKYNPTTGGVLLPRGCSLCGPDLRKCTFRPSWVPTPADELPDRSNRGEIFKITGTGYFFGFTFFDKINATTSHHLLSAFGFASQSELDAFYTKIRTYVGSPANLSNALAVTRTTEYEIVGPIDGTPDQDWDTTQSASPYIFNCSLRSEYGMGGIHADGAKVTGLKSMVTANYTGVSLQKDMTCWELYNGTSWVAMPNYTTYISSDPNNVRMKPTRRSFHIRAINGAFIQEVSIFAIGQGVHHATESGSEVSITNSNSSFGGCVAISTGYKAAAFDIDKKWRFAYFKVPVNISEKTNNIQKYYLGKVDSYIDDQFYVDLETALTAQDGSTIIPDVLGRVGYTLRRGSYVWVENPNGNDFRAQLSTTRDPWNTSDPDRIYFADGARLQAFNDEESSEQAPGTNNLGVNRAVGRRVYVRRLTDTRSDSERKLSIGMFAISAATRLTQRDYILQLDPTPAVLIGEVNPFVNGTLPTATPLAISNAISATISDANFPDFTGDIKQSMEVQLVRNAPVVNYANNTFYREGTTVTYNGKHFTAIGDVTTAGSGGPLATQWQESYVHMPSDYRAGDKLDNTSYTLLLDDDNSNDVNSITLGYDFSTVWTDASPTAVETLVQQQYRTSNDYLAAYDLLRALGFSEAASHAALQPRATADRIRRVNDTAAFPTAPSGGLATARNCWAAEFRRPSVLRLFGHAFEWAGTLNYSKAFPAVQQQLTPLNKFTYYFTNELGGRAYATGFNEEGFLVKPTGIEDISTGQSRSLTSLAVVDEDPVNAFPTGIDVGGTSFFNDVVINGVASFNFAGSVEALGPVFLAGKDILESEAFPGKGTTITPAEFDTAINNGNQPNVVTLEGLNYWRQYNALLSAKALSFETGTDADEVPVSGMLGRMAFVDEWCGYAQGGGSVTQATSKATGVELNTPCGQIIMDDDALAADTAVAFTLTNSQIAPQDVVAVSIKSGATAGAYAVSTLDIASGSVKIVLRNLTAGSLSEAVVLNFVIIKSTTI